MLSYASGPSSLAAARRDHRRQPQADRRAARRLGGARRAAPAVPGDVPPALGADLPCRSRPDRSRRPARGPRGHLVAESLRVGGRPVCDRPHRRHPRQHQPGVPNVGARVRARSVRRLVPDPRARLPPGRLRAHARRGEGRAARSCARRSCSRTAGARCCATAAACRTRALAAIESMLQFDDPINIQYTSGTTGFPEGRDAVAPQHPQQRFLRRRDGASTRPRIASASRCRSITASAWCWATSPAPSHGACIVVPGEAFDAGAVLRVTEQERCTSLYGVPTMFIAELEHAGFDELRSEPPAHRDHGRVARARSR